MDDVVRDRPPDFTRHIGTLRGEGRDEPWIRADHIGGYRNLAVTAIRATSDSDGGNPDAGGDFGGNPGHHVLEHDAEATSLLKCLRSFQEC